MHERSTSADSVGSILSRVRDLAHRRARDQTGHFWVEGVRQFVQACDAGFTFEAIIHSRVLLKSSLADMLARRLASRGVRRVAVSPEQFRAVCAAGRASGIGAIARQRWMTLTRLGPDGVRCRLVLERVRSPGNLGTILRTAEATGAAGVIILDPRCDPFDPAAVRASMGGLFHLQLTRTHHAALRQWADAHGVKLIGLSPDALMLWTDAPLGPGGVALVVGEERKGLTDRALRACHDVIRLPMPGRADSLNVAVAAGVMLYEVLRRRAMEGAADVRTQRPRV